MPRLPYDVLVSRTFQSWFDALEEDVQARLREGLEALEDDPYEARSGADIRRLENTDPVKHRLRVGNWRVIYVVDDEDAVVRVVDGFRRGRGYR